jgi:hypothetical protein
MKLLQNPIVVGLLVVVALALVFRSSFAPLRERFRARKTQTVPVSPPPFVVENPPVTTNTSLATNPPQREVVAWKRVEVQPEFTKMPRRDPFQYIPLPDSYRIVAATNVPSLAAPVKTAQEMLALKAIWLQTGSQLAVINGKIVGEGSSISDYKVEKIEQDRVWVSGPIGQEKVEFASFRGTNAAPPNLVPSSGPEGKTTSPLKN